ncbi:hypothetical protein LINPERHAP2_LOCUS28701 [Linum perenne]
MVMVLTLVFMLLIFQMFPFSTG